MKKILLMMLIVLTLTSCIGRHSIKVVSGKEYIDEYPRYAKANDTITITTVVVSDAELYVNSNDGTEITQIKDGVYQFVMPDHDIELKLTVIANGGA